MPLLPVEELDRIPLPYELLEMVNGASLALTVESYQLGKMRIDTRDTRPAHDVPVLRVFVPLGEKPTLPHFWDITAKHLIAGLLPHLEPPATLPRRFRVVRHGMGPTTRFTLETLPR